MKLGSLPERGSVSTQRVLPLLPSAMEDQKRCFMVRPYNLAKGTTVEESDSAAVRVWESYGFEDFLRTGRVQVGMATQLNKNLICDLEVGLLAIIKHKQMCRILQS